MFSFNPKYFLLTILLFVTEVLIAVYLHDGFIRPYFGDFLVVILIYCFVKSFANIPVIKTAVGVLLFSYFVEMTQYFKLVKWLMPDLWIPYIKSLRGFLNSEGFFV